MAWIRVVEESEASGELAKIYEEVKRKRGKVAEIMKVHSLRPSAMKAHLTLYDDLLFKPSGLTREELEMLATVVSSLNHCEYCIRHHGEALLHYWKDEQKVKALVEDYRALNLPPRVEKMMDYARKLTETPSAVKARDVEQLREIGFSDEQILQIALTVAYFNFVNRLASGLGVEWSDDEVRGYRV